ncbi:MAG: carbohydrate binding family 9 domain-containing protein, partial [Candidatus Krumholzibacteria bacterium]|nr:carbohydrate binding family 9 domain-containing protein [Candidatus Krumholzibacteria bacterium]
MRQPSNASRRARNYLLPIGLGLAALIFLTPHASAQDSDESPRKQITALRVNPHPPKIDGRLDDAIWAKADFASGFLQKEPQEGDAATEKTEVAFVYDDEAVFVGARMYCNDPDKIIATVSRRDNTGTSERIIVSLDTYLDRRTAYSFAVTASGVRAEYYHSSDSEGNRDYDWDPVWQAKAARTADGWTAEMRIPFTQLRFNNKGRQVWGVNLNRWVPTVNEDSYWVLVPKNENGWSSRMGELVGINGIQSSRRIEVLPYVASDATFTGSVDTADPFADAEDLNSRVGGDIKMGVGPNLTLEGSINPDFGQVEADPAEVNLSAFETFFDERRPFFTEGSQLLSGGGASYFYSRRIGARPHLDPDGDFVDSPHNTSILGAAKLTGRLESGLSVGLLSALTQKEKAKVFDESTGQTSDIDVEPITGYGVIRLQQEFGKDASTAGIILTGVERDLKEGSELADIMRSRAIAGGTDWDLRFEGGKYLLGGNVGFSYIEGSQSAIENAQISSRRYFQRPDNDYAGFDPTRTSLAGWTSDLWFEKASGKHWLWGGGVGAESPGFEINDTGRLGTADDIDGWSWLRYRENEPGKLFQNWWVQSRVGSGWNFGGDRQYAYLDMESGWTLKNFIGTFLGYEYFPAAQSDDLTRGGPSMATASQWNV